MFRMKEKSNVSNYRKYITLTLMFLESPHVQRPCSFLIYKGDDDNIVISDTQIYLNCIFRKIKIYLYFII